MVYSHEYDTRYHPAMPIIEVEVGLAARNAEATLTALVDSGADATLIPLRELQQVGAQQVAWAQVRGIAGISYRAPIYIVTLSIGPLRIEAVRVLGDRQNREMIIGRDVLNQFIVTLNGLANMIEVSQ